MADNTKDKTKGKGKGGQKVYKLTLDEEGSPTVTFNANFRPIYPETFDADDVEYIPTELTDDQKENITAAMLKAALPNYDALKGLTGGPISSALQKQKEAMQAAFSEYTGGLFSDEMREALEELRTNLEEIQAFLDELETLEPYLTAELNKPEYGSFNLDTVKHLQPIEVLELKNDPDSLLSKALAAARQRLATVQKQSAGRAARKDLKRKAKEQNAIMELKGGYYPLPSQQDLWNAFTPGRICRIGTLDASYIDEQTGLVKKDRFTEGELLDIDANDITAQAFWLLSAIMANSVSNYREEAIAEFSQNGNLTFYVKGVLEKAHIDPRIIADNQLTLDRKTAGAIYLENLFEPLLGYIGTTSNGSRYSVFNYIGYDAAADTMTIQTPYIHQLWKSTQAAYFDRQKSKHAAIEEGKKPKKDDLRPLEVNSLFKDKALTRDSTTLDIAVYITNVLLAAGNNGRQKTTKIGYKTIIKNCPRLQARLSEIESWPNQETYTDEEGNEKTRNNTAIYNSELRKIKNAFNIIFNKEECDATDKFEFIEVEPAKKNETKGTWELTAPTKSMINDNIVIKWRRITDE